MPTAFEYITDAMKDLGVLGNAETPNSGQASDGLRRLNRMLDSWSLDDTFVFTIDKVSIPVVNGKQEYTVGPGGDFNITRPPAVLNAFIRINQVDFPMNPINVFDYDAIGFKDNGGFPQYFYYEPAMPLGVLRFYGIPSQGEIFISTSNLFQKFPDLYQDVDFVIGYDRMIVLGLMKELAPLYGMQITQESALNLSEALANVRNKNLIAPVAKTEVAYLGGMFAGRRGWW